MLGKRDFRRLIRSIILGLCLQLAWSGWGAQARAGSHPLVAARPGVVDHSLSIVAADFNRDGFDDLAVANFEAGTITILISEGDGTFVPQAFSPIPVGPASFTTATAGPLYMIVTDFNPTDADGDGVPNAQDNCPNVYNPKDSTSGKQPDADQNGVGDACQLSTLVDTDGDGIPDYDINPPYRLDNCPLTYNPSQTDTDGDNVGDACQASPDIAVLESTASTGLTTGALRIRINLGDGSFTSRPSLATLTGPSGLVSADFNGDGLLDLLLSNSANDNLQFHLGTGDANFAKQTFLTAGDGPEGLATGDFDGNGRVDVAAANRSANTVGLYLNPSAPAAMTLPGTAKPVLPTGPQPTQLLVGRLNADAADDLVVVEQGGGSASGKVEIFLGPLPTTQTPVVPTSVIDMASLGAGHRPRGAALADFDLDGVPDLAIADIAFDQVLIYKGNGDGSFTQAASLGPIDQPGALAVLNLTHNHNDPGVSPPDLAVLTLGTTSVELFRNDGGMSFTRTSASPAAAWKHSTGLGLFGADPTTGNDILLLHDSPAWVDVLAGIGNGFFRATPYLPLQGPTCTQPGGPTTCADSMITANLLQDTFPDLLVTDNAGNKLTVLLGRFADFPAEGQTLSVADDPIATAVGPLLSSPGDYDKDGVPDVIDNCPTRYNPPGCPVTDPTCSVVELCKDTSILKTDCAVKDPITQQCDSDGNGVGDQCQLLDVTCTANLDTDGDGIPDFSSGFPFQDYDRDGIPNALDNCPTTSNVDQRDNNHNLIGDACELQSFKDTDQDGVPDYDVSFNLPGYRPDLTTVAQRVAAALDNCPTIPNPGQEDNNDDNVGNACQIAAALDNCPWVANPQQGDDDGDGIGNDCAATPNDIVAVSGSPGALSIFTGDGSGRFREAPFSPFIGFSGPSAALVGPFGLEGAGTDWVTKSTGDILLAQRGLLGTSSDDRLQLYLGKGNGILQPQPALQVQGDPDALFEIPGQSVCHNPHFRENPDTGLRFNMKDDLSPLFALLEPATSTVGIYLVGDFGLQAPPAHPAPLPVSGAPVDLAFGDLNNDHLDDLLVLTAGDGDPSTPNLTIYMGLGNGLFYTDPSFNPADVKDGGRKIATGFIDIQTDSSYRDVVVYNENTGEPGILLNILPDRADIDDSGRVDGFDLALLANAFGASRGDDFTIQSDGTLLQSGSGYRSVVVGSGNPIIGQNLQSTTSSCDFRSMQPGSGNYGLAVDLNLDGTVDGLDLALLATQFGRRLQN